MNKKPKNPRRWLPVAAATALVTAVGGSLAQPVAPSGAAEPKRPSPLVRSPSARAAVSEKPPADLIAAIPPRPATARSGSEFVEYVRGMNSQDREEALRAEILAGNLPPFLRQLRKVELCCADVEDLPGPAGIWVMPDYLAIGSDEDFVRFPASFATASLVARRFGFVLPTTVMVDAIYRQAELRLPPLPMTPGKTMTSTAYFAAHDRQIRLQMSGFPLGELAAGHKKDYVLTNRLAAAQNREAIYGWHRGEGQPIQPLSLVHGARYADYSHGVRLVSETIYIGEEPSSFYDLIEEPQKARLLSAEGVIKNARRLMEPQVEPRLARPEPSALK